MRTSKLTETTNLPTECWIYENRRFVLYSPMTGNLPTVSEAYKKVLDRNGIPYREGKKIAGIQFLEYWNPEFYQETEKTLPVFARSGSKGFAKKYIVTGTIHSEMVPTAETVEKANLFSAKVENLIAEEVRQREMLELALRCEEAIEDDLAVGIELTDQEAKLLNGEVRLKSKNGCILCIPFSGRRRTAYAVLFNATKIKSGSNIILKVPAGTEGIFIGYRGENVKSWAGILKVKYISVVSE